MNNREYDVAYIASFLMEHGHIPMSQEVFDERSQICESCNYYTMIRMKEPLEVELNEDNEDVNVEWQWMDKRICGKCGCDLAVRLEEWMGACPLNKWRFSYEDWEKHLLPHIRANIEDKGGSDYYLWEGVLESEDMEKNNNGE